MKQKWFVPGAALFGLALAGCGFSRDVGLADRCVDFMAKAAPDAGIDVTERRTVVKDGIATADIAGVQNGEPIAAECRYEHEVLIAFRWRQGPVGPALSGSSQPPP